MSLAERAYNVRTLGWRMWLRCELRNIALLLRLIDNQVVFPVSGWRGSETGLAGGGGGSDFPVLGSPPLTHDRRRWFQCQSF